MMPEDIQLCRDWADLYRERGFNPLPSRPDAKRPCCRYADYWSAPAPASLFERFPTTNVQVICGRAWRLLVIDLDGEEAINRWAGMGSTPRTWISHSGAGGRHLWFRLPADYPKPLSKAFLWKSKAKHTAIERLCDNSLVMAPPSIHPKTGKRYRFISKERSPLGLAIPAECPDWVLRLGSVGRLTVDWVYPDHDRKEASFTPRRLAPNSQASSPNFDRAKVLDSIRDKIALARSWGVRVAGRPSPKGWVPVHAINREDTHASAAIHIQSGHYVDRGSGVKLSLFDLGAELGIYSDWREAIQDLGERYA